MSINFTSFLSEVDFLSKLLLSRIDKASTHLNVGPLVKSLDLDLAKACVLNILKPGAHQAIGIDGSMAYEERMEIVTSVVSIVGYTVPIYVSEDGDLRVNLKEVRREDKYTVSTIVPIWVEDVNEVLGIDEFGALRSVESTLEDIPLSIMTFGEYYQALSSMRGGVEIVFLDRPLASSIHPCQASARRLIFERNGGVLSMIRFNGVRMSLPELYLAAYVGPIGPTAFKIPCRGYYRLPAILQRIISNGGDAYKTELIRELRLSDKEFDVLINKLSRLNDHLGGGLVDEITVDKIILNPLIMDYWEKATKLIDYVGHRLFKGSHEHPLYYDGVWLGTQELNVITLLTIYELAREALLKNRLLVGIGKDTYATDLYRSVIPYAKYLNVIDPNTEVPIKCDKPLLTLASSLQKDVFRTPWRFAGYDESFVTLVYDEKLRKFKAARRVIFREGLIVRFYFQLRTLAGLDGVEVKSPVFFYDRFQVDMDYNEEYRGVLDALEKGKGVRLNIYFEGGRLNPYDNMVLYILSKLDAQEVSEATGHNYLLFLADKDAKMTVKSIKDALIEAADSHINKIIRDKRVFVITRRFRDFRTWVERRRAR